MPKVFVKGIILTFYKGAGKDKDDPASYRPVCLLPHVTEEVDEATPKMLTRISKWQKG